MEIKNGKMKRNKKKKKQNAENHRLVVRNESNFMIVMIDNILAASKRN